MIEATVGPVAGPWISDQKFGLEVRGWGSDGLHDEPLDDDEHVLTIRLTIDSSLEPRWEVVNDRQAQPRAITARDRESIGAMRLGGDADRHLAWGRGSALLRLTDSSDEMTQTLAAAYRSARQMVDATSLENLSRAAALASDGAKVLGAGTSEPYRPALDTSATAGAGALGLHQGNVPLRAAGLGTRRLAALAVQLASFPDGGIALIDEIETGLEPHRLRHLVLREKATAQVLMTTHSEISVVELPCAELFVVRSVDGVTTVRPVPDHLQGSVRAAPEALLGRRIILAEGPTEVGLLRALDQPWTRERGAPPADRGVVLVAGGGSAAASRALGFSGLGFDVALLADSDVPLSPARAELAAGGVEVVVWSGDMCTEQRVALDLPWDVFQQMLEHASSLFNPDVPQAALDAVASRLPTNLGTGLDDWLATGFEELAIRSAAGHAAKAGGWFKRTDLGELLGRLVADALPRIGGTDLATKLAGLHDWAYAD